MASIVINGPVVQADVHNTVLRDAVLHSPVERTANSTDYHVIEVGVREGEYTSWIGTWDQSGQKVNAGEPSSILDEGRPGMRLRAGQALVLRVSSEGSPASLAGARVTFSMGLVGGRAGKVKPLVEAGVTTADPNTRVALAAMQKQVNTGGLSEWDESIQLADVAPLVAIGTFHGRIQRDSATRLSLQRYSGNWVEVDGEALSITSSGLSLETTSALLTDGGTVGGTRPSAATLYYVYVGSEEGGEAQLRLCATAPSRYSGAYYLGTSASQRRWRFAGWVRLNGSTQFVDDSTDRLVVNYHNRLRKEILLRPGYNNNNANTTYTTTSTSWTPANAGTGATASYIANGEDAIIVGGFAQMKNSGASVTAIGLGDNSTTTSVVQCIVTGATAQQASFTYVTVPAAGYRTLSLLVVVSGGTGTYYADAARLGSSADPVATGAYAMVAV